MILELRGLEGGSAQPRYIDAAELRDVLNKLQTQSPCVYELTGDFDSKITFGIGGPIGFIQHSPADGAQPYLVAINPEVSDRTGMERFLAGNTPTEIPRRYCLPFETVAALVLHYADTGARSPDFSWDEI